MKPPDVTALAAWLKTESQKIAHGEVTIRFIIHDKQIRQIERSVTERTRPEAGE